MGLMKQIGRHAIKDSILSAVAAQHTFTFYSSQVYSSQVDLNPY